MDLDFTPDQLEFRDQVRTWLDENKPTESRPRDDAGIRDYDLAWQRTQAEGGWAGIAWPTEYGGKGPDAASTADLVRGVRRAGIPRHRCVLRRQLARRANPDDQGHRRTEDVPPAENPWR